jgi:hypothetical protein|tara:strand:+ start:281 stop:487 length:207 start_codon:yes stop_codon:yes gene_type:complete
VELVVEQPLQGQVEQDQLVLLELLVELEHQTKLQVLMFHTQVVEVVRQMHLLQVEQVEQVVVEQELLV